MIGGQESAEALVNSLKSHKDRIRSPVIKALVNIGSDAVNPCIEALSYSDWWLNKAAAEALGRIGDKNAIPYLINVLNDADEQNIRRVGGTIQNALKALKGKEKDENGEDMLDGLDFLDELK